MTEPADTPGTNLNVLGKNVPAVKTGDLFIKTISRILSRALISGDEATNPGSSKGSEHVARPPVNIVQVKERIAESGSPADPAIISAVGMGTESHVPNSEYTRTRPISGKRKFSAPKLPSNRERTIRCGSDAPAVILPREENLPAAQDRSLPLCGFPQRQVLEEGDGGSCKSQVGRSDGNWESRPESQQRIANHVLVKDSVPAPSPIVLI